MVNLRQQRATQQCHCQAKMEKMEIWEWNRSRFDWFRFSGLPMAGSVSIDGRHPSFSDRNCSFALKITILDSIVLDLIDSLIRKDGRLSSPDGGVEKRSRGFLQREGWSVIRESTVRVPRDYRGAGTRPS